MYNSFFYFHHFRKWYCKLIVCIFWLSLIVRLIAFIHSFRDFLQLYLHLYEFLLWLISTCWQFLEKCKQCNVSNGCGISNPWLSALQLFQSRVSLSWNRIPAGSLQESNRWWVVINDSCGSGGRWSVSGISLSSPAASNAEYTTGLYRNKTRTRLFIASVVKKSIIYYIDYTRVLFFYVTIYLRMF